MGGSSGRVCELTQLLFPDYPLCGETLEPLARFVRKLPKDSNLAEDGFPGLINQEFLGSFSTDQSICSPNIYKLSSRKFTSQNYLHW